MDFLENSFSTNMVLKDYVYIGNLSPRVLSQVGKNPGNKVGLLLEGIVFCINLSLHFLGHGKQSPNQVHLTRRKLTFALQTTCICLQS